LDQQVFRSTALVHARQRLRKRKTMEKHGIMDASERTPKISNSITSEDTIA
jgi:hypothetical protein